MKGTPYTKQEIAYISSELIKAVETHEGIDAIQPNILQHPMSWWYEIPLEGRAKIIVHNPNQANKLYGQLNGVDMLGNKVKSLPSLDANCQKSARGTPGKAVVINYQSDDLRPLVWSDVHQEAA